MGGRAGLGRAEPLVAVEIVAPFAEGGHLLLDHTVHHALQRLVL